VFFLVGWLLTYRFSTRMADLQLPEFFQNLPTFGLLCINIAGDWLSQR